MKQLFTVTALLFATLPALAEVTTWGYCPDIPFEQLTPAGTGDNAFYHAACLIPYSATFQGSTLQAVQLPIRNAARLSDLTVWIAQDDQQFTRLYTQTIDAATLTNESYNTITLDAPFALTANVYVGYTFAIRKATIDAAKNPLLIDAQPVEGEQGRSLLSVKALTDASDLVRSDFRDYTSSMGALALRMNIDGMTIPACDVTVGRITSGYTTPGQSYQFSVPLTGNGSTDVNSITYEMTVDGATQSHTASVSIPAGFYQRGTLPVQVVGPEAMGPYTVSLRITEVNGQPNYSAAQVCSSGLQNYSYFPIRRTVVEEFTGTGCPNCPRGIVGMELLRQTYPDRFIGMAIHRYNTSDPMYPNRYAELSFTGAPQCIIDRKETLDPLFGSQSTSDYILGDFARLNAAVAPVDVAVSATWQEGTSLDSTYIYVDLQADVTALQAGNYDIAFALVADSLTGTTKVWQQTNNYAGMTASSAGHPALAPFCKGGEYGLSSVLLVYNDVVISSSYDSYVCATAPTLGQLAIGEQRQVTCTLQLPVKASLLKAIKAAIGRVSGVVLIIDSKGQIANAAKSPITGAGISSAIHDIQCDEVTSHPQIFSPDGSRRTAHDKGFLLLRNGEKVYRR